mmetsp:Transcript_29137/g.64140  ORF Transcript_29137/g.64140 Transcript_29137/m.64140 type:complete len:380 (-) Transcript_29137:108-1247(-)
MRSALLLLVVVHAQWLRNQVCRMCFSKCPISCFVGTCSTQYGTAMTRFGATSQCYTCDPGFQEQLSRGGGDFAICTPGQSQATQKFSYPDLSASKPAAAGVDMDALKSAAAAQKLARDTAESARRAAMAAEAASRAAASQFGAMTSVDGSGAAEAAHLEGLKVAAAQAVAKAEAATMTRLKAQQAYDVAWEDMKADEEQAKKLEAALAEAEVMLNGARRAAAAANAAASQAAAAAAGAGVQSAALEAQQAAASAMASAARGAHSKLQRAKYDADGAIVQAEKAKRVAGELAASSAALAANTGGCAHAAPGAATSLCDTTDDVPVMPVAAVSPEAAVALGEPADLMSHSGPPPPLEAPPSPPMEEVPMMLQALRTRQRKH